MIVLIVDDHATNRKLLSAQLEAEGHAVFEATDGLEALQVLERERMDAIVSDILMPNMDGFSLCREIRKSRKFNAMPFVFYTSTYNSPTDRNLALNIGADGYLTKPASSETIVGALREVVQKVGGRQRPQPVLKDDAHVFKQYSEVLVNKLEEKNAELQKVLEKLRAAHAEILDLNRDLEKRVQQRTADLRQSEERFRTFADHSPASMYLKNAEGRYVYMNKCGLSFLDKPLEMVLGKDDAELYGGNAAKKLRECDLRVLREGQALQIEEEIDMPDGTKAFWMSVKFPIHDAAGQPCVGGFSINIKEYKALEGQLRHLQKMEAVGQLVGGIAHDFNNTLAIVSGYSDRLLRVLPKEHPCIKDVEAIRTAAYKEAQLVRQLLAFSRQQVLQFKVIGLEAYLESKMEIIQQFIGESIEVTLKKASRETRIKFDPNYLEQVLLNLASNARDAMPDGGKLTFELGSFNPSADDLVRTPGLHAGPYIFLKVKDTGQGMPPDIQKKIFEPFFTTKEIGKGTGLGLSTTYGIVRQSGGHILCHSVPGKGTEFVLYFPEIHEQPAKDGVVEVSARLAHGKEIVLIVEDDLLIRKITEDCFQQLGYKVFSARGGEEALELCRRKDVKFDLLFTDIAMPGIQGNKLAECCRELIPQIKVLFTSGYGFEAQKAKNIHPDHFLPKPYSMQDLVDKIRRVLDGSSDSSQINLPLPSGS